MCSSNLLLGIIAIIFPPLPVWIKRGLCSVDSLINIALCLLGFLPGLLHAWYIISVTPDDYELVPESGDLERGDGSRVSYYYVNQGQVTPHGQQVAHPPQQQQAMNYGTTGPVGGASGQASSGEVPPTYNEAVKGDHKVQSR